MSDKSSEEKRVKPPEGKTQPKEEQDLDEALYDSFPASDPVSMPGKGEPTAPARDGDVDRKPEEDKSRRK
jgi:hypothetical protein